MQTIKCPDCKAELSEGSFTPGTWARKKGRCRTCQRAYAASHYQANRAKRIEQMTSYRLERNYGVTAERYQQMLVAQGGRCAICGATEGWYHAQAGRGRRLAVDHDHNTGEVRGLLCDSCNMGIGRFGHSPDLLRAAINYLSGS